MINVILMGHEFIFRTHTQMKGWLDMANSENSAGVSGRLSWQRPSVVRMGAADAEGNTMMSMVTDTLRPRRMMGS